MRPLSALSALTFSDGRRVRLRGVEQIDVEYSEPPTWGTAICRRLPITAIWTVHSVPGLEDECRATAQELQCVFDELGGHVEVQVVTADAAPPLGEGWIDLGYTDEAGSGRVTRPERGVRPAERRSPPARAPRFGATFRAERTGWHRCAAGHDEVVWEGTDKCWMCGEPGDPTFQPLPEDQELAPYGWH